jgi:hypothetical protein
LAQVIEFQFLSGYTALLVDVIPNPTATPVESNLLAVEGAVISPTASIYSITAVSGLLGIYTIAVHTTDTLLMSARVNIDATAGPWLAGTVYPLPSQVLIGIDRGDGVFGTLQPCLPQPTILPAQLAQSFSQSDRVELLSLTGGRTNTLARVLRQIDNDVIEIETELTKRVMQVGRHRIIPVFRTV